MQSINLHSHAQTFTFNESKTSHYAQTFTFKMLLREIDFQVHLGVSPPFILLDFKIYTQSGFKDTATVYWDWSAKTTHFKDHQKQMQSEG